MFKIEVAHWTALCAYSFLVSPEEFDWNKKEQKEIDLIFILHFALPTKWTRRAKKWKIKASLKISEQVKS